MRDALAERLLATVMSWTPEDVARERPILQAMASYKYDDYQQFSPGMRFTESLALWLSQFKSQAEKAVAYEFAIKRLIFCSSEEMSHLVSIAYPDHIRPFLLRAAAIDAGLNERHVSKVASTTEFRIRERQCLFLGLSDGARIGAFRRYNRLSLSHEQVLQTYEISGQRVSSLLSELYRDLEHILGGNVPDDMRRFRTIVLLDDFSASGISYARREHDGTFAGKIANFHRSVTTSDNAASRLVYTDRTEILILLYMATTQAREHIQEIAKELWEPLGAKCYIEVVYPLNSEICLKRADNSPINALIDTYYDPSIYDEHMRRGGTIDAKYGFASCGLPLVLGHNTPNNSLALIWSYDNTKVRGLFPRVQRHRESR